MGDVGLMSPKNRLPRFSGDARDSSEFAVGFLLLPVLGFLIAMATAPDRGWTFRAGAIGIAVLLTGSYLWWLIAQMAAAGGAREWLRSYRRQI